MDETLPTPRRVTTGHRAMAGEGPRRTEGHTRPCEECGSIEWTTDLVRGEVTCGACGLVAEEAMIDPGRNGPTTVAGTTEVASVHRPPSPWPTRASTPRSTADLRGAQRARHGLRGQNRRDWARRRVIDDRSKSRSPKFGTSSRRCSTSADAPSSAPSSWRRWRDVTASSPNKAT